MSGWEYIRDKVFPSLEFSTTLRDRATENERTADRKRERERERERVSERA